VILVETSAWVEFLRGAEGEVSRRLRGLIQQDEPLATTEVVVMEVLAGARDDAHLRALRRLLLRCELLAIGGLADYEEAAALYRLCRRRGETVRRLVDCLVAVVAIRSDAELLHADADFDAIARHTELRITAL
jgi:predicted nucleic acid-binding protein